MLRNPTYHRRRTERQRREEAKRAIAAEHKRIAGDLAEHLKTALGAHLDARGNGADIGAVFSLPAGPTAH